MSGEEINEYVFTWKIKNYFSCNQTRGQQIVSPLFSIENIPDFQWCLWFYPRGSDTLKEEYVACFLECKLIRAVVTFSLEILDEKCCVLSSFELKDKEFKAEKNKNLSGSRSFMAIKDLMKKMSFWTDDVLTLRCRIKRDNRLKQKFCGTVAYTTIQVDRFYVDWNIKIPSLGENSENIAFSVPSLYNAEIILNSISEVLSIFILLNKMTNEARNRLVFTISVVNKIERVLASKRVTHVYENTLPWKFPDFITKEILKKCEINSSFYEFQLKCEICINKNWGEYGNTEKYKFSTSCSSVITKDNATSSMPSEFKNLFSSKKYSDVTIRCKNDEFSAHKFVLKVRSPVLATMFDQDMLENKTGVVDMADIDGKILKAFLEFLYTDRVDEMDYDIAKNLILTADKYQVPLLVDECAFFLKSTASIENVCEIIAIADMIDCKSLKSYMLSFIELNAPDILLTAAWTDLIERNIKLATHILSNLSANIGKSAIKNN